MKRIKIFLLLGGMVMLSVGVLTAYRQMQTAVPQESKLTLADIEALAAPGGGEVGCVSLAECSSGATIMCTGQSRCEASVDENGYKMIRCDDLVVSGCY